jgi:DNA-directed RNA polymerase subunit alpha
MEITLPNSIGQEVIAENHAVITVSPCYPGYGTTLGNALRRVLLSSLPGAAVTAIKIKGVDHEFSTIDHVKEDVVEIILNIKGLRFRVHGDEPVEIELHAKGDGTVTASQFDKDALVEVVNPEHVIATITDKAGEFHLKAIIQKGRGYVPVEEREHEKLEIGYIAVDSIYTPVRNVNFRTEHVRVGEMTNYDKLFLDVVTDGTVSPQEAFEQAAQILVDHFAALKTSTTIEEAEEVAAEEQDESVAEEV